MSSNTTRLGLKKPDASDPFSVTDFQTNWGRVDDYPGIFTTATSTSRPGTPWTGQVIYETDTRNLVVFDGFQWGAPLGNLAWCWWGGISPWLTTSGPIDGTPNAGSFFTYGAHKFRIPTNRPRQAMILSGAISFEMQDPVSPGATNFGGTYLYINGNLLPQTISTATVADWAYEAYPYQRPGLSSGGYKITMAIHPQIIQSGLGATNARISQDNSLNVKVANGFLNGQVRCTNYTLLLQACSLGPGSNAAPGNGTIPLTAAV